MRIRRVATVFSQYSATGQASFIFTATGLSGIRNPSETTSAASASTVTKNSSTCVFLGTCASRHTSAYKKSVRPKMPYRQTDKGEE